MPHEYIAEKKLYWSNSYLARVKLETIATGYLFYKSTVNFQAMEEKNFSRCC